MSFWYGFFVLSALTIAGFVLGESLELHQRGIVKWVSRELIRIVLHRHELKPWLEKNVVRS